VAKYVYSRATANGKRAPVPGRRQEPGDRAARCGHGDDYSDRAGLVVWLRRPALPGLVDRYHVARRAACSRRIAQAASSRKVGYGLDQGVEMGPVITAASQQRIEQLIGQGQREGAEVLVDGAARGGWLADGFFVRPDHPRQGRPARRAGEPRSSGGA